MPTLTRGLKGGYRHKEITDGRGQVKQTQGSKRTHETSDTAQLVEVVRDADEGKGEEHAAIPCIAVFTQHVEHLGSVLVPGDDTAIGSFTEKV